MTGEPLRILIVDDEEIVHLTLGGYLSHLGHTVVKALDGKSALAAMEGNDFDMVLVDIRMPGMDGLTLISRARAIAPGTSFVIITGLVDVEITLKYLRHGATDVLAKPVRLHDLDGILSRMRGGIPNPDM